jgi:CBS domain-containing protein
MPFTAKDIMPDLLVVVSGDATLEHAAGLMLQMDIGSLLVVDDRKHLVGILTDTDFGAVLAPSSAGPATPEVLGHRLEEGISAAQVYRSAASRRVRDVMSTPVVTVDENASIETVLARMFQKRIRHLPVMRGPIPVGVVSSRDLLHLVFTQPGTSRAS